MTNVANKTNSQKNWKDEELVTAILLEGNTKLFGYLYDRYSKKVFNKCYSFVKNKQEAKDLAQDVFLRAYLKLESFDAGKSAFSTWLYVVTYNLCTNYVSRMKKSDHLENEKLDKKIQVETTEEEIDIDQINKLDPEKLTKVLDTIPVEDKALLLLKYQDNTSIKDIQKLLEVSESAVKMRLNRAKLKVVKIYHTI